MSKYIAMFVFFLSLFTSASAQVLQTEENPSVYAEVEIIRFGFYLTGVTTTLPPVEIRQTAVDRAEVTFDYGSTPGTYRIERTSDLNGASFQSPTTGQLTGVRFVGTKIIWTVNTTVNWPNGRGFFRAVKPF